MEVKSRHHLRSDEVAAIRETLAEDIGIEVPEGTFERVELEGDHADVVLRDGEPFVMYVDAEPFLTVRGANAVDPKRRTVTVDAGAISFVSDGADVMRPGITAVDEDIEAGNLVIVTEETHDKALAIGRALVDGTDMHGDSGRVVETIHHVSDELYEFSP